LCTGAKRRRARPEQNRSHAKASASAAIKYRKGDRHVARTGRQTHDGRDILEFIGTTTIAGVAGSTVAQSASAQAPEIKRVGLGQAKAAAIH
jgi:hypothetical protein